MRMIFPAFKDERDASRTYASAQVALRHLRILVRERWDRGSFGVIFRVERAGHPEAGSFALKLALQAEDARIKRERTACTRSG